MTYLRDIQRQKARSATRGSGKFHNKQLNMELLGFHLIKHCSVAIEELKNFFDVGV